MGLCKVRGSGRPDVPAVRVLHAGSNSHRSTGYQSNFRPVVYYSPNLDRKDNPHMGLILRGNYTSITSRDFTPLHHVTGAEPLPHALYSPQSGFIRSNEVTNPKGGFVKSVHFDTRDHGSEVISGISPQHRPLLFVPQGKGSPEVENFQHGPSFMSTEYKTRFTPKASHHPGRSQTEIIGEMENSGFTEGSNLEPITHDPYSQYRVPLSYSALPALAGHSDRDSGFSRELDQVLRTNAPFNDFQPKDRNKNKDEVLGRTFVEKKETSGFSNNNLIYVRSEKEPPQQYLTNYNLRFYNPVPRGRDREGWTRGGIQKQLHTGFSVNNELHRTGI
ncbi:stabilizer of axonemal microtubules 4-like [Anomaloglossus baeobatrachus]|uniref:stabilizer of axonemal microtubules 4-like n=1 Tax=Anomaloglossus baeobatrachus TaxID=238106 RepID=UPI003F4FA371